MNRGPGFLSDADKVNARGSRNMLSAGQRVPAPVARSRRNSILAVSLAGTGVAACSASQRRSRNEHMLLSHGPGSSGITVGHMTKQLFIFDLVWLATAHGQKVRGDETHRLAG